MAERANRYSCAAARSFGLGGGAAFGAVLAGASGATGAAVAAATRPLTAFSFLAGRVGWGFFAAGAETFFTGAGETFFAGAAFGGALLVFGVVEGRDGATFTAFLAGALLAAGDFFAAGFGATFFAAGFFAGAFGPAFFATGFAAFLAGAFFAAAISCLPRPTLVGGGMISVQGTLPDP